MDRRLTDVLPTRRDALKWGGVALASSWVDGLVWPLEVRAQGSATPRGSARNCIFIELGGAISPMDTWDFKETRWTIGTMYEAGKKVARDQLVEAQLRAKTAVEQLQVQQQEALVQLQDWQFANALPLFNQLSQAASAPEPWHALDAAAVQGSLALERLKGLRLPRYLKGSRPYIFIVFIWVLASLPAILLHEWYYWLLATTLTGWLFAPPIGLPRTSISARGELQTRAPVSAGKTRLP